MHKRLIRKPEQLRANPNCGELIRADAKDAEMAWGIDNDLRRQLYADGMIRDPAAAMTALTGGVSAPS